MAKGSERGGIFCSVEPRQLSLNNRQMMTYRVASMQQREDTAEFSVRTKEELDHCGAYYSVLTYDPAVPDTWAFAE